MNCKYKGISLISTVGLLCLTAALTACEDDLGDRGPQSGRVIVKVEMPAAWNAGTAANENAPDSRCTAVTATETTGDTPLYLHTIESDNPAAPAVASRGEMVNSVSRFSLSGVCYTGTYDELAATPNFAYDVTCTVNGSTAQCPQELLWPTNGKVRFFAYSRNDATDPYSLSSESAKGSPKISYTVPSDVKTQHDLLAACTDATSADITLHFHHILTAVKIVTAKDMIPGTITRVTLSGVYNGGTYTPSPDGSDGKWKPGKWAVESSTGIYTVTRNVSVNNGYTETDNGELVGEGSSDEVIGETENLTLMMIPQTLPEGAKLEIEFTENLTGRSYTLFAHLTGEWPEGKIVTYSISPSSFHIKPVVNFSKNSLTAEKPDSISYAGVWYDATYSAQVAVTQANAAATEIVEIPEEKVSFKYKFTSGSDQSWHKCTTDADGVLKIEPQPAYETMRKDFDTETEAGSEADYKSLTVNSKTANCYLVDKAGYFSLPLVYGNGNVTDPIENTKSLNYYPKHDDGRISSSTISDANDAVLCWQDAPDLIDPASVKIKDGNLVFHIRKQTITQGNALLAVRNASKDIIWSWHIWVTPYKDKFYTDSYTSSGDGYTYKLAKYNLGWCDSHVHNPSRNFMLKAVIDLTEYKGPKETEVEIGTFKQDVYKGSDAGDNTYYQWGRKDPMLGGIYNTFTPLYTYKKKGSNPDEKEFTMENKQVFNQYYKKEEDGKTYDYRFCKNPGDMVEPSGEASKGVTIGYAIKHPYMFVANSKEHNTGGHTGFNYRNHWHIPYADYAVSYLDKDTHIMFNAWNSAALDAGRKYPIKPDSLKFNALPVAKTIYDPCPPGFKVAPINAFYLINQNATKTKMENKWVLSSDGGSIEFPLTGLRNYALRSTEWETVEPKSSGGAATSKFDYESFYKISMPAFRMLTYISSATIVEKETWNAYQVYIFIMDERQSPPVYLSQSSNSYGLSVRPMRDEDTTSDPPTTESE